MPWKVNREEKGKGNPSPKCCQWGKGCQKTEKRHAMPVAPEEGGQNTKSHSYYSMPEKREKEGRGNQVSAQITGGKKKGADRH